MKLIKISSSILLACYLIAAPGCSRKIDEFGDINTNPGIVADPITAALFTNSLASMANDIWISSFAGINGAITPGLYGQIYSETQYTEASRYQKQQPDFSGYYATVLFDCQNIINFNSSNPGKAVTYGSNANQVAIARIIKAWFYSRLTNEWGDLPYSQALKFEGAISYDNQQSIYNDLFKELKEAVAQFDGGAAFQGDILFGGDINKWKRFANSLRVTLAVRLAKIDATKGKAEVLDALAHPAGVISSYTDDAMVSFPGGNFLNPFYNYYNITQRRDFGLSSTLTEFMNPVTPVYAPNGHNDKRVFAFGSASTSGTFVKGFPYGLTRTDAVTWSNANTDWARIISNSLRTATMPVPILTASQIYLARAQAAQMGWTAENASAMYANGIEQGWRQWGVYNAADLAAYMADPTISLAGGSQMSKIFRQRWISSYPDGAESWNIWREANGNGNNYLTLTPAAGSGLEIPRRFAIAQNQFDLNPNTQTVAQQYTVGGESDSQYARIWWDKQ